MYTRTRKRSRAEIMEHFKRQNKLCANEQDIVDFGRQAATPKELVKPLVRFNRPYGLPLLSLLGCGGLGMKVKHVKYSFKTVKSKA